MCTANVDLKFSKHFPTKWSAGQHTFNSRLDNALRRFLNQLVKSNILQTTGITGVRVISFLCGLVASHTNFLRVNHNDVIAGINVGSIFWFMLTAQACCNFHCQTTQSFTLGVYDKPITFYCFCFCAICFHLFLPGFGGSQKRVRIVMITRTYYKGRCDQNVSFLLSPSRAVWPSQILAALHF